MMNRSAFQSASSPITQPILLLVIGLWLALAFFVSEHDWRISLQEHFTVATDDAHLHTEGGALTRRLAFPSIAVLGLIFLVRRQGRRMSVDNLTALLWGMFFAWCAASLLWSNDSSLTVRRLVVCVCCVLGASGVARQIGPRGLCILALIVTTLYIAVGVGAEVLLGTFRPLSSEYRFGGTMHPNAQGLCCGVLCLSAACLMRERTRWRSLIVGLLLAGFGFLVLTKSRASLGSLIAALGVLWALDKRQGGKIVVGLGLAWVVCMGALVASLAGVDLEASTTDVVLMGRHDSTTSLNGRTPVWTELFAYIGERPLLGYGYEGFWDSGHIQDIASHLQWTVNSAHSSYLDTVLSIGLIGAGLLLLAVVASILKAVAAYRETPDSGVAFTICLLIYGALNGLLESGFLVPTSFIQFVVIGGVLHEAFFRTEKPTSPVKRDSNHGCAIGTSAEAPQEDVPEQDSPQSAAQHETPS